MRQINATISQNSFARTLPSSSQEMQSFIDACTTRVFSGVGSRQTPEDIGVLMAAIAMKLTDAKWILRSGAANGADLAFESGVRAGNDFKEIYLPYPGFNGSKSALSRLMPACFEIASSVHPNWDRCSEFAKKAHARNAYQVMGYNLSNPAAFVVCWTKDGAIDAASAVNAGGTRTAIVLAQKNGIPVFNLCRTETKKMFLEWVGIELLSQASKQLCMNREVKPNVNQSKSTKQSMTNTSVGKHGTQQNLDLFSGETTTSKDILRPPVRIKFRQK